MTSCIDNIKSSHIQTDEEGIAIDSQTKPNMTYDISKGLGK